jgi:hypothetical protein
VRPDYTNDHCVPGSATMFTEHFFYNEGTLPCEEEIYASLYVRNGNTLTITEDGEIITGQILQLDANHLKISFTEDIEEQSSSYIVVLKRI